MLNRAGLVLLFVLAVSCFSLRAMTVDATDISNRLYEEAALKEIQSAKKEILVAMYALYVNDREKADAVHRLLEALIEAHKRRVSVEVILDNSPSSRKGNQRAYEVLSGAGIRVDYSFSKIKMHAKLIIVDSETVIDGSANWTQSAMGKNIESNSIVRSAPWAEIKKKIFRAMEKDPAPVSQEIPSGTVKIPAAFICDPGFAPLMITNMDQYAFDLYLALLQDGGKTLTLDYKAMALRLGIKSSYFQTLIYRALKRLKAQYRLIDFTAGRKPQITLVSIPGEEGIFLPGVYWDYGLNGTLKLKEKFALLICLYEQGLALPRPFWSMSKTDMEKKYHVTVNVLGEGLRSLERQNMLEIAESKAGEEGFSDRTANEYRLKPFVSPEEREKIWKALEEKEGVEKVKQAKVYASKIGEENNPESVEKVLGFMRTYKKGAIDKAVKLVGNYKNNNPLKNIRYLEGVIKNMDEGREGERGFRNQNLTANSLF